MALRHLASGKPIWKAKRRLNLLPAFWAAMGNRRHSAEKASHAKAMGTKASGTMASRAGARLYLVTPPLGDPHAIADTLAAALNAADIAAVLLRLADGSERELLERIAALRILSQSNGAALLPEEPPEPVA